ncbi:MAG: sulfotransferase family protein [Acidimicrobiales bacterium]
MSHEADAPVFLLGAARSGTTLLYKALCLHPEAAYISNWVQRYPGFTPLAVLNRFATRVPQLQRRAWFQGHNAYVYGERRPLMKRLTPAPVEGERLFAHCGIGPRPVEEPPPVDAAIVALREAFASVTRWGGGRVLVSKRIANNWRIPLLLTAFPEARFVAIVRDGRAVAVSLSRVDWWDKGDLWWTDTTPRAWRASGGHPMELCARNWVEEVEAIERGIGHVPAGRVVTIRYEDFIEAPHAVLADVAGFAGLQAEDSTWRERLGVLEFPNANDGWRRVLEGDDLARVEAIEGEALGRYGYPTRSVAAGGGDHPRTNEDVRDSADGGGMLSGHADLASIAAAPPDQTTGKAVAPRVRKPNEWSSAAAELPHHRRSASRNDLAP